MSEETPGYRTTYQVESYCVDLCDGEVSEGDKILNSKLTTTADFNHFCRTAASHFADPDAIRANIPIGADLIRSSSSDNRATGRTKMCSNAKVEGKTPTLIERRFDHYLRAIEERKPNTIKTPWGGVFIVLRDEPRVEKFLVVRRGAYLAFEKHSRKVETLSVHEGHGIILAEEKKGEVQGDGGIKKINAHRVFKGSSIDLLPGELHCVIAASDLLIFETADDYLGMDNDLIFIFEPN